MVRYGNEVHGSPMADARAASALVLEAIPLLMCHVRDELAESGSGLSIAQFRCLKMVQRNADVSLGDLADAHGVSPPAMSKLVEGLVEAGLLERRSADGDRRRIALTVSPAGRRKIDLVVERLRASLAERLGGLSAADLAALERALPRVNAALSPAVLA